MHVNTAVVRALMQLRQISDYDLCNLVHVTQEEMANWLDNGAEDDESVSFETQLEILKLLGISGEAPRNDVVHYWRVHEPLFSKFEDNYWALQVILKAFGSAKAVFVTREADPAFTLQAKAHFALKFGSFMAMLEVTASPFRSIGFDPDNFQDLEWVPETFGVLLEEEEYARLQPGAFKVKGLQQYLTYNTEVSQWEKLREAALEKGISAESVASILLGGMQELRSISNAVETPSAVPATEAAVAEPQATEAKAEPAKKTAHTSASTFASHMAAQEELSLFVTPVKSRETVIARNVA